MCRWDPGTLDPNSLIYIPYPRVNCLKTIPFTAAHTHIAHIWQYPGGLITSMQEGQWSWRGAQGHQFIAFILWNSSANCNVPPHLLFLSGTGSCVPVCCKNQFHFKHSLLYYCFKTLFFTSVRFFLQIST